jgi:hypothetical protein
MIRVLLAHQAFGDNAAAQGNTRQLPIKQRSARHHVANFFRPSYGSSRRGYPEAARISLGSVTRRE